MTIPKKTQLETLLTSDDYFTQEYVETHCSEIENAPISNSG